MIGNLVTCLMAYKARMEYQALHFDGDRPAQYKELRKELAKLYEIEDVSLFGPVSLSSPTSLEDISEDEKNSRGSFADSSQFSRKRSPWPRPGMKFPYEIKLEFILASRAGAVSRASQTHMNRPLES